VKMFAYMRGLFPGLVKRQGNRKSLFPFLLRFPETGSFCLSV